MTKIKHTNRHVYSINRQVHIACFNEILLLHEFISHKCFQPLILKCTHMHTMASLQLIDFCKRNVATSLII